MARRMETGFAACQNFHASGSAFCCKFLALHRLPSLCTVHGWWSSGNLWGSVANCTDARRARTLDI